MKDKEYDVKKGSALWRHKMRESYKAGDMEVPEKFKLKSKGKALKKMKKKC